MKRPPRQVWLLLLNGVPVEFFYTKREAQTCLTNQHPQDRRVAGPYILAERVREK